MHTQDTPLATIATSRAVTPRDLVADARDRFAQLPAPMGAPWTLSDKNHAAALDLAEQLLKERAERMLLAGRLHNLVGDLEVLREREADGFISDTEFLDGLVGVVDHLQEQVASLKAIAR